MAKSPVTQSLSKRSLASHTWLGLVVSGFMYLICLSGTIAVLGDVGNHLGYGMKRGSLLLTKMPQYGIGANFNNCGAHTLSFLPLMFTAFKKPDSQFANVEPFSRVPRFAGDIGCLGMG